MTIKLPICNWSLSEGAHDLGFIKVAFFSPCQRTGVYHSGNEAVHQLSPSYKPIFIDWFDIYGAAAFDASSRDAQLSIDQAATPCASEKASPRGTQSVTPWFRVEWGYQAGLIMKAKRTTVIQSLHAISDYWWRWQQVVPSKEGVTPSIDLSTMNPNLASSGTSPHPFGHSKSRPSSFIFSAATGYISCVS